MLAREETRGIQQYPVMSILHLLKIEKHPLSFLNSLFRDQQLLKPAFLLKQPNLDNFRLANQQLTSKKYDLGNSIRPFTANFILKRIIC